MLSALMMSAVLASSMGVSEGHMVPLADPVVREPDAMTRFFPFGLADNAEQPIKDGLVISHVLGFLLGGVGGGLWGPLLVVPGAELNGDVVVSWLVPWGITMAGVFMVSTVASVAGIFLWPLAFCSCAACPIGLGGIYISTNATLMAMDRNLKSKKGPAPPKRSSGEPAQPASSDPASPPPPSYAY